MNTGFDNECWACGEPKLHDPCLTCGQSAQATDSLPPGTVIAQRYRIETVLGRGGFGITYVAHHDLLNVKVAVKEFFPSGASRSGLLVRSPTATGAVPFERVRAEFLEEGRTVARFNHPGIVKVLDAVQENNTSYLVMELLRGDTVEGLVSKRGPFVDAHVRQLLTAVAAALGELHRGGVLHRDIKPANVFWQVDRGPVLIDFGSARQLIGAQSSTATALVSPGYAPIEQYQQRGTFGPPTDLYGLGATAYFAMTGQVPISSLDRSLGSEILGAPSTNDQQLADAVMSALEVRQQDRPADTAALTAMLAATAVRPITASESQQHRTAARPIPAQPVHPARPAQSAQPAPPVAWPNAVREPKRKSALPSDPRGPAKRRGPDPIVEVGAAILLLGTLGAVLGWAASLADNRPAVTTSGRRATSATAAASVTTKPMVSTVSRPKDNSVAATPPPISTPISKELTSATSTSVDQIPFITAATFTPESTVFAPNYPNFTPRLDVGFNAPKFGEEIITASLFTDGVEVTENELKDAELGNVVASPG